MQLFSYTDYSRNSRLKVSSNCIMIDKKARPICDCHVFEQISCPSCQLRLLVDRFVLSILYLIFLCLFLKQASTKWPSCHFSASSGSIVVLDSCKLESTSRQLHSILGTRANCSTPGVTSATSKTISWHYRNCNRYLLFFNGFNLR